MFANRLAKRYRHLAKWAARTGTEAFRLYDRDIPEIPLVLDFYGGGGSPRTAALAGALYRRPYEKDDAEENRWLDAMRRAASEVLGAAAGNIFFKRRERQRGDGQYEKTGARRFTRVVREGGLRFKVNLSDYLDTGLFLDRRLMRAMIRDGAGGKRVLNLFSYTGSFSVYAAAGGAVETVSVDLSNTYRDWAAENFALNGLRVKTVNQEDVFSPAAIGAAAGNMLVRADVLAFLDRAGTAKKTWDLIILDPPAFSNSKKMTAVLDLKRDHQALVSGCLGLLAPGGTLYFSANPRGFTTGAARLEAAFAPRRLTVTDITAKTVDEDFRGRKTPLTLALQV
jgi:23S rRNA G2069 N7-methylase RlmK/C1962 C5-methylase RlmI